MRRQWRTVVPTHPFLTKLMRILVAASEAALSSGVEFHSGRRGKAKKSSAASMPKVEKEEEEEEEEEK